MIKYLSLLFLICAFNLLGFESAAKNSLGGQFYANTYLLTSPTTGPNTQQTLQSEGGLWLDGEYDFTHVVSARATLTADEVSPAVTTASQGLSGNAREAYIEAFSEGMGFKVGRQIISWGKSDGINPTDYFSGFNYTIFNPDKEYQRIATNAAMFNYSPDRGRSHFNFTAVLVADPPRTKILPAGTTDSGVFVNIGDANSDVPFVFPELGLKLSYTGRGWDASFSTFVGHDHTPNFQAVNFSSSPSPSLTVSQYYQSVWSTGGDFSVAMGEWVLRGEGAFTYDLTADPGYDPSILPDHLNVVLGIERPLGDYFRFAIQGIYQYVPNFISPSAAVASGSFPAQILQQVAVANQLLEGTQYANEFGESLRVEFDHPASGLNFQIFLLHYNARQDTLFLPTLTYHWNGNLKIFAGANNFSGPSMSPFGAYSVYNSWFAGGTFYF